MKPPHTLPARIGLMVTVPHGDDAYEDLAREGAYRQFANLA